MDIGIYWSNTPCCKYNFIIKMKKYIAKEDYSPLYRKGDEFSILETTNDEGRLPITAKRLRDGRIYYFNEGDLEEIK